MQTAQSSKDETSPIKAYTASLRYQTLLPTAIIELLNDQGDAVTVRALLDQGAEFSFLTERVSQCLSLIKTKVNIPVVGKESASPGSARSIVSATLRSPKDANLQVTMKALVMKKLTDLIPATTVEVKSWSLYKSRHDRLHHRR